MPVLPLFINVSITGLSWVTATNGLKGFNYTYNNAGMITSCGLETGENVYFFYNSLDYQKHTCGSQFLILGLRILSSATALHNAVPVNTPTRPSEQTR